MLPRPMCWFETVSACVTSCRGRWGTGLPPDRRKPESKRLTRPGGESAVVGVQPLEKRSISRSKRGSARRRSKAGSIRSSGTETSRPAGMASSSSRAASFADGVLMPTESRVGQAEFDADGPFAGSGSDALSSLLRSVHCTRTLRTAVSLRLVERQSLPSGTASMLQPAGQRPAWCASRSEIDAWT
jgi:hypothetical protein